MADENIKEKLKAALEGNAASDFRLEKHVRNTTDSKGNSHTDITYSVHVGGDAATIAFDKDGNRIKTDFPEVIEMDGKYMIKIPQRYHGDTGSLHHTIAIADRVIMLNKEDVQKAIKREQEKETIIEVAPEKTAKPSTQEKAVPAAEEGQSNATTSRGEKVTFTQKFIDTMKKLLTVFEKEGSKSGEKNDETNRSDLVLAFDKDGNGKINQNELASLESAVTQSPRLRKALGLSEDPEKARQQVAEKLVPKEVFSEDRAYKEGKLIDVAIEAPRTQTAPSKRAPSQLG